MLVRVSGRYAAGFRRLFRNTIGPPPGALLAQNGLPLIAQNGQELVANDQ